MCYELFLRNVTDYYGHLRNVYVMISATTSPVDTGTEFILYLFDSGFGDEVQDWTIRQIRHLLYSVVLGILSKARVLKLNDVLFIRFPGN
jgi:hypothetical protein